MCAKNINFSQIHNYMSDHENANLKIFVEQLYFKGHLQAKGRKLMCLWFANNNTYLVRIKGALIKSHPFNFKLFSI